MTVEEGSDMTVAICAKGIAAGYGLQPVISDVDIEVHAGEVVALLGANGAGKTTTLLAMAGELPLLAGTIEIGGEVSTAPLHRRARNGLTFVTEERSVFMDLTTADNFRVGGITPQDGEELFPELRGRRGVNAGLLSGGEQQMLTLARALARRPKILLADELSLGLGPQVVQRLLAAVRAAAASGAAVLLVEQHVRNALAVADRAYVMRRGRVALSGTAGDLLRRIDEIETSYLGGPTQAGEVGSQPQPPEEAPK
jgi:branched-chain amino acid transport system ATP-binding protein